MRITIIGAGFSGVALAAALHRTAPPDTVIHLVGVGATFGRGVAYGAARPEHLLNTRARELGVDPQVPQDFADWFSLGERGRVGFLPRQVYGEYLYEQAMALTVAKDGPRVLALRREVVAIDRADSTLHVHLDDGATLLSDRIVIAIGTLPPPTLAGVGPRLAVSSRYVGWPWQDEALEHLDPDARVLIVGTGLTMVDVVASLKRRGHGGPITAISRHGLSPLRHEPFPHEPLALPPSVRHALATHDLRALVRVMRSLSRVADVRMLADALRPYLQVFWRGLSAWQRSQFLRHARTHWEVIRHRLAPQAADSLEEWLASGQLRLRAARLMRASLGHEAVEVVVRDRGSQALQREQYDVLIRATGLHTDVARTPQPLLAQLRETGLICPDPSGLGVSVTDRFEVLDTQGRPVRGLFCLGPLLHGKLWEITAIPEIRAAAHYLASRLLTTTALQTAAMNRRHNG